jgi:hypothetical protein
VVLVSVRELVSMSVSVSVPVSGNSGPASNR